MRARTLLYLLALACILAGVEAKHQDSDTQDNKIGDIKSTIEILGAENITVVIGYPFSGMLINSSSLRIDPTKKYMLILVEKEDNKYAV